jgi:hypothetical protein
VGTDSSSIGSVVGKHEIAAEKQARPAVSGVPFERLPGKR